MINFLRFNEVQRINFIKNIVRNRFPLAVKLFTAAFFLAIIFSYAIPLRHAESRFLRSPGITENLFFKNKVSSENSILHKTGVTTVPASVNKPLTSFINHSYKEVPENKRAPLSIAASRLLIFSPNSLSFSVLQNGTTASKTSRLSSTRRSPVVTLTKSANSNWLILPPAALASLSFGINAAGLVPGTYTATVTASASRYSPATLTVTLMVTAATKFLSFTQSSQSADVEQGSSQDLPDFISSSDNVPASATLRASAPGGAVPTWLTINGSILNGINYTTGSEITFHFDATNLSIGTYTAIVTASAAGYTNAVLNISLMVTSAPSGPLSNLKVNFQDSATVPPAGWLRDYGQSFGPRSSSYQGTGNTYGWLQRLNRLPLSLTRNGRNRATPADILLATFIHMQGNNISNFNGTAIEGIWEAAVTNGNYDVTVSVGDATQIDSKHTINVEGVNAITGFIPLAGFLFKSATITVSVSDGYLTIDAIGGINTKINWVTIQPYTGKRPSVVSVNPDNSSVNVSENTSISTSVLKLPNGGINNSTITSANVYLTEEATGVIVPSNVNGTGGGDAITLVPSLPLKLSTTYRFNITTGVMDLSGASFIPYVSKFTTGSTPGSSTISAQFDKVNLPNTVGQHSTLSIGPDGKLYALTIDGIIKRFSINADGTLGTPQLIYSLQDVTGTRQQRLAIGLAFDPAATVTNLVAYITHSTYVFLNGPDWDGRLTRLSGTDLQVVQDVLVNLPRSAKDHLTNSIAFGPDGALYFTQGSNSAMGRADNTWSNRSEHLLNCAVLRLDRAKLGALPLDVKTAEGGGSYNPYLPGSPLTIYASGVRNAFDLLWHSNGQLYAPTNGSAAGGNTPASVPGTLRPNGTTYNGPSIPALTNVQQTQKDFLFRIIKGGYYGHPNALRGEYVMNGGNPSFAIDPAEVEAYPVGTSPDANWRGYSFDFQTNASPDGVIEYKSNAFNGTLKGKILVVRYSQHDDIITLTPGGVNKDIISSVEGPSIVGFTGFIDPLNLTEDVRNGNIYVSEYGGSGKITLLKPRTTFSMAINTQNALMSLQRSQGDASVISDHTASQSSSLSNEIRPASLLTRVPSCDEPSGALAPPVNEKIGTPGPPPSVYPNPLENKFRIRFPAGYAGDFSIQIIDAVGRVYQGDKFTLPPAGSVVNIDVSKQHLKAGVYFLKINSSTRQRGLIKLIVDKNL